MGELDLVVRSTKPFMLLRPRRLSCALALEGLVGAALYSTLRPFIILAAGLVG